MKLFMKIALGFIGLCVVIPSFIQAKLRVGDKAPDFSLPDETGIIRTLTEFRGKKVVLYFYPKDETSGCTAQACSLKNGYTELQSKGIVVLGVSFDSVASHKRFKEKHNLPFSLLSDSEKKVAAKYGAVWNFILCYAPVPSRMTFLIDEQGIIVAVLDDIDIKNYADDIIKAFG